MIDDSLDVAHFRHVVGKLSRQLRTIDAASNLTPTQSSVLNVVVQYGRMGLSELARLEGINATLLSRSIATLESRGLVRRLIDERDRRAASLEATPAGARLVRRLRDARSDALRGQIGGLTGAEQRRLARALPVLERLVERLSEPGRAMPRDGSAARAPVRPSPRRPRSQSPAPP
ncbi:MAG TPA: MarR family transcriptional regulator [Gaiellaceae bacterium]|nr:MarR family transcriptional regulator [Gaiellaceae bacterium]